MLYLDPVETRGVHPVGRDKRVAQEGGFYFHVNEGSDMKLVDMPKQLDMKLVVTVKSHTH